MSEVVAMWRQPLPASVAGLAVPQDEVSIATWRWAQRSLPGYLFRHSARSYCWGMALARRESWSVDTQILWTASLLHDLGLTRTATNTMCFEVEGAEIARTFLERHGMDPAAADRAAIAIILHMRPGVALDDGVEAVLLDRATGLDVRGVEFDLVSDVRADVVRAFPRGDFDRRFVAAIGREVAIRTDCQSARLLGGGALVHAMLTSPWASRARDPE